MVVGSIILYRTYAFFEEKKEFNILKGQIPEFVENDIAIRLNGTITDRIPDKGDYNVEVACDNAEGSWNYVDWKIDVKEFDGNKVKCSLNFIPDNTNSNNLSYKASIGDYVSMTPTLDEYVVLSNLTGYSTDQTINPKLLKIWRIIKINEDGTMDMISEYTSYEKINFYGKTGYQNIVGTLNLIASAYGNSKFTINSRHIGYNGQTPFLSNNATTLTATTPPWSISEVSFDKEPQGAGENMYENDFNLVSAVYGNCIATQSSDISGSTTNISTEYWISGRRYGIISIDNNWYLDGLYVASNGAGVGRTQLYNYTKSNNYSPKYPIRPILTLKPNIQLENQTGKDGKSIATAWQLN